MCGIAGFYNVSGLSENDLETFTNSLRHRGPDGSSFFFDQKTNTGLGHRRLSIIDLSSKGTQPMTYKDSGKWIIFNGEVYNYIELKKELLGLGYSFATETDTEVILASYIQWGEAAFPKFNGMWAMVIYDAKENSLLICNDRYGIKPLYFSKHKSGVLFASEQKAFFSLHEKIPVKWDKTAVRTSLLALGYLEACGKTIFQNIESILPGQLLLFKDGIVQKKIWWKTSDHLHSVPASLSQQAELFRELFMDACRLRLRSDVPMATSLSGGIDSSTVVAALAQITQNRDSYKNFSYKTFVHRFQGTPHDETQYAEAVVDKFKYETVFVDINEEELTQKVDQLVFGFESIYPGPPDAPWRIYKAQREHGFKISIDGHGADEMLGGYHQYFFKNILSQIKEPKKFVSSLLALKKQLGPFFSYKTAAQGLLKEALNLNRLQSSQFFFKKVFNPLHEALNFDGFFPEMYVYPVIEVPDQLEPVNAVMYADFHQRLLPRILRNFDLPSMAHGIEVRMPFMDYRLVNLAFSLPASSKLNDQYTKVIVREAFKDLLPKKILERKLKLGFNSPLFHLLKGPLKNWIYETLKTPCPLDDVISRDKLIHFYENNILQENPKWSQVSWFWAYVSGLRLSQILEKNYEIH